MQREKRIQHQRRMGPVRCQRDRAMEYYRQAVQVGDDSRNAQTSAKDGLGKAFGDQCR